MSNRLTDKVAIITGASSGLGRAIALAFAAQGTRLVVCADLSPSPPEEEDVSTHALIEQRYGKGRGLFLRTDVSISKDVEACVGEAVRRGGKLDIMVNNAGLGFEDVQMHEMREETWDRLMKVNLRGVFLGSKFACTQFLKQDLSPSGHRGWVINTASGAGLKGVGGGAKTPTSPTDALSTPAAYCASKGAVVNFTRAVAIDYAPHKIHVNALCPGYLKTPMTKCMYTSPETSAKMMSETPWGTLGEPEDVAKVAVFLASEDAALVTGVAMPIDGGWAAG
ncbi:hypothetical protein MMC30_006153 [Trapelia coarctata]|nr:hypothetical protein [Trapelia coarctata]